MNTNSTTEAADLGPLPEPDVSIPQYGPSQTSGAMSQYGALVYLGLGRPVHYSAEAMESERRRCFALGAERERERCARICEEARAAIWPYHDAEVVARAQAVCENLAARIRGQQ